MKNVLFILSLILTIGFGCKKSETKDGTNASTTSSSVGFDGTLAGKWQIVSCPKEFYVNDSIPSSTLLLRPDGAGQIWGSGWSNNLSWHYSQNDSSIVYFNVRFTQQTKVTLKSPGEYKFDVKGQTFHLKKIENMVCPKIELKGYTPNGAGLIFNATEGKSYLRSFDPISNLTITSFNPQTGECYFSTRPDKDGSYVTFNIQGCGIITFENEKGVWKRTK